MRIDSDNIDGINIPEGLEARLSNTIDKFAADERHRRRSRVLRASAACVISVVGILAGSVIFKSFDISHEDAIADTYSNPEDAAKAVNYAVGLLQQTLDQSFAEIEQVNRDFENMKNTVITL